MIADEMRMALCLGRKTGSRGIRRLLAAILPLVFCLGSTPAGIAHAADIGDRLGKEAAHCSQNDGGASDRAAPFPHANNTGVPLGSTLTRYVGTLHIDTDDAVISNLEVIGDIVVEAKNVTVKNTRLVSNTPWHAIRIMEASTGFMLIDSEIDGRGKTDNGVYGFGIILRSNIHDVENGATIWGPSIICDSLIQNLRSDETDPHFDGIQINGGRDIAIVHNTVINDNGQTSTIIMGNTFSGLSDILIDSNHLIGGGYTLYLDGRKGGGPVDNTSIRITNNRLEGGHWGSFALYDNVPVMSGNTDLAATAAADEAATAKPQPNQ